MATSGTYLITQIVDKADLGFASQSRFIYNLLGRLNTARFL